MCSSKRIALAFIALLLTLPAFGETLLITSPYQWMQVDTQLTLTGAGGKAGSAAAGTLSARNVGNCAVSSGTNTCSISIATFAGDLDIAACDAPNASPITSISSGVVSSGTLGFTTASQEGSYGTGAANTQQGFAYVLPSQSGAHSSPTVLTLADNASSSGGFCYLAELTPSANGSLVGLATDFSYQPAATCANCTQASVTVNGTNEAFFQGFMGSSGYTGPTAVASPYTTNAYFPGGNGIGFAISPNPGNGNGATWTNTSIIPVEVSIGFS